MLYVLHYILQLIGFLTTDRLPLGHQSPAIPVPEFTGFIEPIKFFNDYVIPGRPVVFRGAVTEYLAYQRWSDEYFLSIKESDEWLVQYEVGKKETRQGGQDPIPFSEYIRRYRDEDLYCVTGLPKFLRDDLQIFAPLNCDFMLNELMDDLVMWFSSGGTKSVWHYDDYENFNCLIKGKKELILANRSQLELGHFQREGSYSNVDVDAVDLDKYPGFEQITFYNATLEAGDCVYIPTFWGHAVRSWGRNIAINAWWEIYKTPFECTASKAKSWDAVKMITDSDVGKVGEEQIKDTESRLTSAVFRLVLWISPEMRKEGQIPQEVFLEIAAEIGLGENPNLPDDEQEEEFTEELTKENWSAVFTQLDTNGDGYLQPHEIDVVRSNEVLQSLIQQATASQGFDSEDKQEL